MKVVVDFSYLAWSCFYGTGVKTITPENQADTLDRTIRNFDMKLGHLEQVFEMPAKSFLLVKDSRAQAKYDLFPDYKAGRHDPGVDPRPAIEAWLRRRGYRFFRSDGWEADDVIATLAATSQDPVTVVTGDHDLWQLMALPHVSVFDARTKMMVTPQDIEKKFGVQDPRHIALTKALWGDKSDNLPNLAPRLQKALLPVIRASDGTWQGFWATLGSLKIPHKACGVLFKNYKGISLNFQLATLSLTCPVELE